MSDIKHIAVLSKSALLTLSDVVRITNACAKQIREHAAPDWGEPTPHVLFVPSDEQVPEGWWPIQIFDDADQADALGYHDVGPDGLPYAKSFVRTTLENGGELLSGHLSVSSVVSHEVLEAFGNPFLKEWVPHGGLLWARELADAVEGDSYDLAGISVSNYLTPEYFRESGSGRFDRMGILTAPFTIARGGYAIRQKTDGSIEEIFGPAFPPWKVDQKAHPAARTAQLRRKAA